MQILALLFQSKQLKFLTLYHLRRPLTPQFLEHLAPGDNLCSIHWHFSYFLVIFSIDQFFWIYNLSYKLYLIIKFLQLVKIWGLKLNAEFFSSLCYHKVAQLLSFCLQTQQAQQIKLPTLIINQFHLTEPLPLILFIIKSYAQSSPYLDYSHIQVFILLSH